jgi:Fe-S-cluster-containing hydrogenase component 2
MAVIEDGVLTLNELQALPCVPGPERLEKGAVAVIECPQDIPCNPCQTACPHGAIVVGEPITNIPVLKEDLCDGCGLCVAPCPGQAIFIVDMTHGAEEATVSLPYEFLPLPFKGQTVEALNRRGEAVHQGSVVKVLNPASFNRTAVVTVSVPRELAMEVRGIRLSEQV